MEDKAEFIQNCCLRAAEDCESAARWFRTAAETGRTYDIDEGLHNVSLAQIRVTAMREQSR